METQTIKINLLEQNVGQVPGLPSNPRTWTRQELDNLKASIRETPELLEARGLIVYPYGGKYVIIGGNMRHAALSELGEDEAPCIVLPAETTTDKLKELVIKDNGSFGKHDWDKLANEWDDLPLSDWGVPTWQADSSEEGSGFGGGNSGEEEEEVNRPVKETIPEVEELLNKAMQENCKEFVEQIDLMLSRGWLLSGYTVGWAKAKFLRALYYGEKYPRHMSFVFHPHQFKTSANVRSIYDQLKISAEVGEAGIAGFRTTSEIKGLASMLVKVSYPIGGARMPLDFPVEIAKDLIEEFGGKGGRILDPCHGWGGRFVGALLAGASGYVGCDPSDEAHDGLCKMKKAYLGYCPATKEAEFMLSPYEDCVFDEESFDFAITSPPYFDVEQYHGERQAHVLYPNYYLWRDGFYHQLIANTYKWLKPGCAFVLQVGSQTYPLLEDGTDIAKKVGFIVEDIRPLGGGTNSSLHGNTEEDPENEKIIILRKPKK